MKKFVLTAILLFTLSIGSFAIRYFTISTPCGYFSGTAEECGEFVTICLESMD